MPFTIIRQDITKIEVDAIVNAANTELKMGGGVSGAIFKAAGVKELEDACKELAPIKTGEAVLTPGFNLKVKYIIHTAGPIYIDGNHGEEGLLRLAYQNSLKLAYEHGCESIAFPLISSGIYGYPKEEALKVARLAIEDFLKDHEMQVYLLVFDLASFVISQRLKDDIKTYIDEHYVSSYTYLRSRVSEADAVLDKVHGVDDYLDKLEASFSICLFRYIDEKGLSDVDVYKRANLDRRLFSKIRSDEHYMPSKRTILALAIALHLNLDETNDLLACAGYTLSKSQKADVIIEYFIKNKRFDIFVINEALFAYDQKVLGG